MLDSARNLSADMDATLERLREEVVSLSMNLETLADRPPAPSIKTKIPAGEQVELFKHFS